MEGALQYEEIRIGNRWKSLCRTVTESDVVQFAGMTGDFNPLHVDQEYAAKSTFRRPIAHGLLGLAWVAGLGSHCPLVDTIAFLGIDQWDFKLPVYVGDTMHVVTEVVSKQPTGRRRGEICWQRALCNQKDEVVQVGIFRTLVACGAAKQSVSESYPEQPGRRRAG